MTGIILMSSALFDGDSLFITLPTTGSFEVESDLYSAWKTWLATSDNAKYPPAFETTGGDNVGSGQQIAPYFFCRNDLGWKIKMPQDNGEIIITGNLFPRIPGLPLFEQTAGYDAFLRLEVSTRAVVITVNGGGGGGGAGITDEQAAQIALIPTLSTFDPATDTVENVNLVNTTTTNTDMRGTDGANDVEPDNTLILAILEDTNQLQQNQGNWATATGFSTFDSTINPVTTDTVSRNASKADVSALSTFDPTTDTITQLTDYTESALPKIRSILVDTSELQANQGNWITATGFSTFDFTTDEVITDTASRNASKADVSELSTFDPTTDAVANVTLVDTVTLTTDMRGTDGAVTSIAGLSTFDVTVDEVTTDTASRNASKADLTEVKDKTDLLVFVDGKVASTIAGEYENIGTAVWNHTQ